jgi:hypothetical protein
MPNNNPEAFGNSRAFEDRQSLRPAAGCDEGERHFREAPDQAAGGFRDLILCACPSDKMLPFQSNKLFLSCHQLAV